MLFLESPNEQMDQTIKHQIVQDKFSTSAQVKVSLTGRLTGWFYFKSMETTRTSQFSLALALGTG